MKSNVWLCCKVFTTQVDLMLKLSHKESQLQMSCAKENAERRRLLESELDETQTLKKKKKSSKTKEKTGFL